MTMTPNSPQELIDMNPSIQDPMDKVFEGLGECDNVTVHKIVCSLLMYLKETYGEKYQETENDQFLWDGCKIGTCVQIFQSTECMKYIREEMESQDDD